MERLDGLFGQADNSSRWTHQIVAYHISQTPALPTPTSPSRSQFQISASLAHDRTPKAPANYLIGTKVECRFYARSAATSALADDVIRLYSSRTVIRRLSPSRGTLVVEIDDELHGTGDASRCRARFRSPCFFLSRCHSHIELKGGRAFITASKGGSSSPKPAGGSCSGFALFSFT
jgi:hypothetical protein